MPDKSVFNFPNVAISILGGLAAAVIFAVVARGGGGALLMAHVAPLPIMIVALGFGILHGATAAILPTIILSIWPHPVIGMLFSMMVALPAFLACYAVSGAPRGRRDILTANLPAWGALGPGVALTLAVVIWIIVQTVAHGSLDEGLSEIRGRLFLLIEELAKRQEVTDKVDAKELSGIMARAAPAFVASYCLLIHVANLWIAGRIAEGSKLLTRPWPDIAMGFRLPRAVGAVFAAGLALGLFPGSIAAIGMVLATTMGLLLAFQGLAVTHVYLRGSKSSALILSVLYFTLGLLGWPLALFTVGGLADLIFDFRSRFAAPSAETAQKTD